MWCRGVHSSYNKYLTRFLKGVEALVTYTPMFLKHHMLQRCASVYWFGGMPDWKADLSGNFPFYAAGSLHPERSIPNEPAS